MPHRARIVTATAVVAMAFAVLLATQDRSHAAEPERIVVPKAILGFDDGDTIRIRWPGKDVEEVRILGIDTPEVLHLDHDLPFAQPFGDQATAFLKGCIAVADRVEVLRSGTKDKYGRTLGYVYVNGKNYSVLVIEARLAYGPSPRFGDNGFPKQYKACLEAAEKAGTPPFEPPWQYRKRMRAVAKQMKADGTYPLAPAKDAADK